jgi:RimJ/RimL family protein N-acetyltransferase
VNGFKPVLTERLLIRRISAGDAAALFAYRGRPDVYRYQSWRPKTLGEAEERVKSLEAAEPDTPGAWLQVALCLRDTGGMIGDAGMHFPPDDARAAEIGYTVSPEYQGRGYATEAARAVVDYLFNVLGKRRIVASVDPRNAPSVAVLEKLGFKLEARVENSACIDGEWCDDCVYVLRRSVPKESEG